MTNLHDILNQNYLSHELGHLSEAITGVFDNNGKAPLGSHAISYIQETYDKFSKVLKEKYHNDIHFNGNISANEVEYALQKLKEFFKEYDENKKRILEQPQAYLYADYIKHQFKGLEIIAATINH